MNPPTIEEVDKELAELEERIMGLNQLVERKTLLLSYKAILERLCFNGNGSHANVSSTPASLPVVPIFSTSPPTVESEDLETSNSPTVNFARRVLSSSAKSMKVPDIVKAMMDLGWTGSGDREKDKTVVYNALYNNSGTRFTRVRRGLWTVKK
jgi:hypothetical protein